jgi:hypothetical protein
MPHHLGPLELAQKLHLSDNWICRDVVDVVVICPAVPSGL